MGMKMLGGKFAVTSLAFAFAVSHFGVAAMAQFTVNVDFNASDAPSGTYSGAGAAPDAGTFWSGLTVGPHGSSVTASFTSASLIASDGTTDTGVTVTLETFSTYDAAVDGQIAPFAPALLNDFVYMAPGAFVTFRLSNLSPEGSYDLYLYSQNGGYNNETTGFTVGGVSQTATNGPADTSGFVPSGNYVLYSALTPDANGNITGTVDAALFPNSAFNGLQLVEHEVIPEPAALSLLGLGAMLALRRRR